MKDTPRTQSLLALIADAGIRAQEESIKDAFGKGSPPTPEGVMVNAFDAMVIEAHERVLVEARMFDKKKGTWGPWWPTEPASYNPNGSEGTHYIVQYRRFALIPLDPPKEATK